MISYEAEIEQSDRGWQAVVEHRYDDALSLFTHLLSQCNSLSGYLNRGITRLLIGDYEGAEADFLMEREHSSNMPSRIINLQVGTALWLQGEYEAACADWANELRRVRKGEINCADAGGLDGTILLWWASAHPEMAHWRKAADKELKYISALKTCQRSDWPGPLAYFLLGSLNEEAILRVPEQCANYPLVQEKRGRHAHFYVGATYLDRGDLETYRRHLRFVVSEGNYFKERHQIVTEEYHLARYELNRYGSPVADAS